MNSKRISGVVCGSCLLEACCFGGLCLCLKTPTEPRPGTCFTKIKTPERSCTSIIRTLINLKSKKGPRASWSKTPRGIATTPILQSTILLLSGTTQITSHAQIANHKEMTPSTTHGPRIARRGRTPLQETPLTTGTRDLTSMTTLTLTKRCPLGGARSWRTMTLARPYEETPINYF